MPDIEISLKKSTGNPTSASGLTLAEPVFNYSNNTLWMGKGSGNTPVWVGAGICGASGGIAAGLTYQIPTLGAVKDYVASAGGAVSSVSGSGSGILVSPTTGAVVVQNVGVWSFNGLTGDVSGVTTSVANTFTALQTFNSGISAAGGITFAGIFAGTTANFTGLVTSTGGFSGSGANLTGNASGLTAGTSTKSIVTDTNSSSTFYPVFVSTAGNTGLNIDSVTSPFTYVPSTGTLTATSVFATSSGVSNTLSVANIQEYTVGGGLNVLTRANFSAGISTAGGTFSGTQTFVNGATFSGNISAPNIVTSFNGLTGAVQGVSSAAAGTGISISAATGAITITNTGVQTFNGLTGAVTGVTVGGANTFTALNSFAVGISSNGGTFSANTRFLSGIQTDSVLSTTGVGGTVYINSDSNGNGGNSITYIGDWASDNNGTSIVVDDTTGTVTINPSVSTSTVNASQVTSNGGIHFGVAGIQIDSESTTLGTTAANQTISSTEFYDGLTDINRSFEFFVQASTGSAFEAIKIIAIHDGTNTYNTQYGVIRSGSSLCSSYTTTLVAGGGGSKLLLLRATPTNTNTTFKVVKTVIPA